MWDQIKADKGVAVITGGASGVGLASAHHLGGLGFTVLIADVAAAALDAAADALRAAGINVHTHATDVADPAAVWALADKAFALGPVAVLMNNAGIGLQSSTLDIGDTWRQMMEVNFFGILNGVQAFVPRMKAAGNASVVINTGSKQGITCPPGNPGYNASKAAVKVLSEQLAHELREDGAQIAVHLFVPGFTYTGMVARFMPEKPDGAWTSEETVDYLFEKVGEGQFYVLCPDNMVDEVTDRKRVAWSAGDIVENRPPLSRWHPDWADAFAAFEAAD
ncbi:SDR family NAD(P)-dependent oxidoreductase [Sulfitobacter aestuariivivens]|uniref:SDR family oxidoreductase n=1 Tax=Sulfitobacter aestuariivivens TaxID=2766981 RepID=A0A927D2E8_9RHOB|nr:SDR family oxidoreductase [Sulfitobacter aestuariivivens]MBD3662669.1 SDR family oxidoreductase [Sulfitobacter aestuariivivens]